MAFEKVSGFLRALELFFGPNSVAADHALQRFSLRSGQGRDNRANLEGYRKYWLRLLKEGREKIYSNGWAFSAFSGAAHYEHRVIVDKTYKDYYSASSTGWTDVAIDIAEAQRTENRRIGGAIVYGHGNLAQESHIAAALLTRGIGRFPWYLLDCSLPYHWLACSPVNELSHRVSELRKYFRPRLIDFMSTADNGSLNAALALEQIRTDIGAFNSAIHFHIGNTVCNIAIEQLDRIVPRTLIRSAPASNDCLTWFKKSDILVIEYLNYKTAPGSSLPTQVMAQRAASEIFEVTEEEVTTEWVQLPEVIREMHSLLKISIAETSFFSMLRRNFEIDVYLNRDFKIIGQPRKIIENDVGTLYVAVLVKL